MSGMVAADPHQGGATWAVLQYALGLARLGHEVVLVEEMPPPQAPTPDAGAPDVLPPARPGPAPPGFGRSESARYFREVAAEFGLAECAALLAAGTRTTVGISYERLEELAAGADLLLNVSGILTDERLLERVPVRAYLDLDPAFNQLWHDQGIDMRFAGHDRFVTVGQAIGTPDCPVPTGGIDWIPTVPPVVLERWPRQRGPGRAWTTVGNWRGYGSVEHEGQMYGQKAHSMRSLFDLPARSGADFELALAIHPGEAPDLRALAEHGWSLTDPAEVAGTPAAYHAFVGASRGEFGVAKSGYVLSRCGWFSDRSACYLACGRPVVAQDTGYGAFLPVGEGLLSFTSVADAAAAIDRVEGHYERHARAARQLAEEHLDSDVVLTRLIERLGSAS